MPAKSSLSVSRDRAGAPAFAVAQRPGYSAQKKSPPGRCASAKHESSLSAQLAEQTSMISSLQNKLRELAGSQDKSRVKALGTDLKDANRRLELALVSVNSEQERANAAEFEAHHEKEGRRYFRRCLKDVDAQLA